MLLVLAIVLATHAKAKQSDQTDIMDVMTRALSNATKVVDLRHRRAEPMHTHACRMHALAAHIAHKFYAHTTE